MKLFTWEITVSTKDDISAPCVADIASYFKKKCLFAHCITETASKLHLHACVCFQHSIEKKHVAETIWKIVEKYHIGSIKRVALKIVVQYDFDWLDSYLKKDPHHTVHFTTFTKDIDSMKLEYAKFFPTAEEQSELKTASETKRMASGDAKDSYMDRLEQEWIEYSPSDDSGIAAIEFLNYSMNVARTMLVMRDERRKGQLAWALHQYRRRDKTASVEATRVINLCEGNCI